jgi:VWFA-related protein
MSAAVFGAQQTAGAQSKNGVYTLHADTHLGLLDVVVTDKHGQPVVGLTKDDFNLLEDGQPQTIKFFEEHEPVNAAEIARQRAAAKAALPPNTFTNYEPFIGRPVTVLLLNQLFPLPMYDLDPLHQRMLDTVQNAPPETPFVIYLLDSELHLVQPVTTDRALLLARINEIWKTPHFGSEELINPKEYAASLKVPPEKYKGPPAEDIPVRRRITSDAMQQFASSLKEEPGRKNLFVFTGGFQCAVVSGGGCLTMPFPNDKKDYLCGLMDTLEQGRMSIYRYYPDGSILYGFGCSSASNDLGTSANYYTLYYTPTNRDWNGKYRATTVQLAKKGLHLAYRKGYYGTPDNVKAHYYTAKRPAAALVAPSSGGSTIAATVVAEETADSENVDTSAAAALPNPEAATFSVLVIPAETTVVPDLATSINDKEKQRQEYRELTLRFSMPASEFKVMPSDGGKYVARLVIGAVGYSDGRQASLNGRHAVQMVVKFNGVTDPRITTFTITGTLTLNIPEHGKKRWLYVSVQDLATGQLGSQVIPMEQIKMPEKQ